MILASFRRSFREVFLIYETKMKFEQTELVSSRTRSKVSFYVSTFSFHNFFSRVNWGHKLSFQFLVGVGYGFWIIDIYRLISFLHEKVLFIYFSLKCKITIIRWTSIMKKWSFKNLKSSTFSNFCSCDSSDCISVLQKML